MKRNIGFNVLLLGLVGTVGTAPCGCSREAPRNTELLLVVESAFAVDEVIVRAMTRARVTDSMSHPAGGRDLKADPLSVLIRPPTDGAGPLQLYAIGYEEQTCRAAAATVVAFETGKKIEVVLSLVPDYCTNDQDADGYLACVHVGCDCDDRNPEINPFMLEQCDDAIDNNCSGLPINEGCPCRDEDPPVACTGLGPQFLHLAGIGACYLGHAACVDGKLQETCDFGTYQDEIASNFRDDDCDGTVDEHSPCMPGTTRPCHRGFVDDPRHPDERLRTAASDLALGECRNPATNAPYGIQTCGPKGRWGTCDNDRLPQRDPERGIGWLELPPRPAHAQPGQCDGLDNDCDGEVDNEPYFDADADGFTYCGTCPHRQGTPKLCDHLVDCDDSNRAINPGQREVCGNEVDEDCRCDHDPEGRPAKHPDSVLGLPRSPVTGAARCSAELAALHCAIPVRSDETPIQHCADEPDPYYHGYVGATQTDRDCHYCPKIYGDTCDSRTGACMTKAAACSGCETSAPEPSDRASLAERRPRCKVPADGGCADTTPPVWQSLHGEDPNDDCGAVSCAGYYYGVAGHRCFPRADQSAQNVVCRGDGTCETSAHLCPLETSPAPTALPMPGVCMKIRGGCVGTVAPEYVEQDFGEDLLGQCHHAFRCAATDVPGAGPAFYFGALDDTHDGRDNPICLFRQDVADSACNGRGACQSRAEACASAGAGSEVPGRPPCMRVSTISGCRDTLAPHYELVPRGLDPYGDCADGPSTAVTCDGAGRCHQQVADACGGSEGLCEPGLRCVDGVCCDAPQGCEQTCYACIGALTGAADGVCAPIVHGGVDDAAAAVCRGSQGCGPDATSCLCDGAGSCKRDVGETCPQGEATCLTLQCVDGFCCESPCDGVCTACARSLTVPSDGDPDTRDGQCRPIRSGLQDTSNGGLCMDTVDCGGTGVCACDGHEACKLATGQACASGEQCASGFCVDGTCCLNRDIDHDGYVDARCGGDDCDDDSEHTYPGAAAHDDPVACLKDVDVDGYGDSDPPPGVSSGSDCVDDNDAVKPGVAEVCDGFDTDCDSSGLPGAEEIDGDDDGYVDCVDFVDNGAGLRGGGDCDDTEGTVHPGAREVVADGVDQDCDAAELCYADGDDDGYRPDAVSTVVSADLDCSDAYEATGTDPMDDCNDADGSVHPGATEAPADGVDQDCDTAELCYADGDDDGYRPDSTSTVASVDLVCTGPGEATGSDPVGDCDDSVSTCGAACNPGIETETSCVDGWDNDCDGLVDAEDPEACPPPEASGGRAPSGP